ncbi:MAG: PAS domain S-box protein [Thermoanaerobaculia bacterium]|nr:PAS domain S-box protein [Thermoanaerobaculia bacterium]
MTDITARMDAEAALRGSEERFRLFILHAPVAIAMFDRDMRYVAASRRWLSDYGLGDRNLTGLSHYEVFPEIPERWKEAHRRCLAGEVVRAEEDLFERADGSAQWLRWEIRPWRTDDQSVGGIVMFTEDITERKRTEEALRASEEELRATFDLASVGVAQAEPGTGRFLRVNQRMCAITGFSAAELLTMSVSELTHPEDRDRDGKLFERVVRGEAPEYRIEKRYVRKDGSVAWVNVNMMVLRDDAGAPVRTVGIIEDITERTRFAQRVSMQAAIGRVLAEAASLAEAMPRILQALCEGEGFAFGVWWESDADSTGLRCVNTWSADPARTAELENQSRVLVATRSVGVPGRVWETGRVVHESRLGPGCPRGETAAKAGVPAAFGFPLLLRGKMAGVLEFFAAEIPEVDPTLIETLGQQIGLYLERKRAEEASARFLAGSPAVLYALRFTPDGLRVSWFSENIQSMTGYTYDEVRSGDPQRWWQEGIHPDDVQHVVAANKAVLDEGQASLEFRFRRRDGTWLWVRDEKRLLRNAAGHPAEIVGSWMDVTARVRLEEQLLQSQKMEAVGQLAGGVAHDFNNLLTVISGNCDLLLSGARADDPTRGPLTDIRAAGERAANLTRQLLAFSRKQILEPKLVDVHEVVSGTEKMLRRLLGEDVELLTDLAADESWVKVDPGQLEQVVVNLAVNARDAMPRGGRITIRTRNLAPSDSVLEDSAGRQPGPKVAISISDTGAGIVPEVKAHLFEPFFTTKGVGKGTGLGLATVFGIVKQSGGDITVESEPGKGATFTVILPSQPAPRRRGRSGASLRAVPRGTETVLAVEDEDAVRRIVKIALESAGYRVIEARDGPEALEAARRHTGAIHLVVTDVVMPEMSGRELVERIVKDHPDVRILYMSGYTDDAVMRHGIVESGVAFLQKPFSPLALARKVREVLDAP